MDQNSPTNNTYLDMHPESQFEKLEREHLNVLNRIEEKLDEILQKIDSNTARLKIIMETLPPIPVTPIKISELAYDHTTKVLWADERYYINFDGKQAELLARLFTKAGKPKKTHLHIDKLVEESFDFAKDKYLEPKTFYLRAKEIQKKLTKALKHQI